VVSPPGPRAIGAAAFLLALLGVGVFIWAQAAKVSRSAQDFPDGIAMVCADQSCGEAFTSSLAEIAKIRATDDDAPIPCPECGKAAVRATVCPECGASSPASRFRATPERPACPHCGKPLPKLIDSD